MDEGGVQFYLDHIVVVYDSGAMLGIRWRVCRNEWKGRKGVRNKWRGGEGVGEEGRRGGRREERRSGYDYSPSTPT